MSDLKGFSQMQARLRALEKAPQTVVGQIVIHAVAIAKHKVPRKTSNLGRTIRPGRITANSGELMAGGSLQVGYARYVEQGTRPHIIRPKPGRVGRNGRPAALAWGGNRRLSGSLRSGSSPTHFAREVHHPGTKAHPYLVPALEEAAKTEGVQAVVKIWNSAA